MDVEELHKVKTTPENVKEANEALFCSKINLPQAANHCGITHKLMKINDQKVKRT